MNGTRRIHESTEEIIVIARGRLFSYYRAFL